MGKFSKIFTGTLIAGLAYFYAGTVAEIRYNRQNDNLRDEIYALEDSITQDSAAASKISNETASKISLEKRLIGEKEKQIKNNTSKMAYWNIYKYNHIMQNYNE
jgi:hypothetical protein